jgi:hypothetical protein
MKQFAYSKKYLLYVLIEICGRELYEKNNIPLYLLSVIGKKVEVYSSKKYILLEILHLTKKGTKRYYFY